MKKENGVTMLVLVITIVLMIVLASVTLSFVIGDEGMVGRTSKASFETDIQQIYELVEEKEELYVLENVVSDVLLTESVKQSILGKYYANDDGDRLLDIEFEYSDGNPILTLAYYKNQFNKEQIEILKEYGAVEKSE